MYFNKFILDNALTPDPLRHVSVNPNDTPELVQTICTPWIINWSVYNSFFIQILKIIPVAHWQTLPETS